MKYILILLLSICSITSYSQTQTKAETEDWLTYYLNKYCAKGSDCFEYKKMMSALRNKSTYYYYGRKFSFAKSKLVVTTQIFTVKDSTITPWGVYLEDRIDSIPLKNALRVELTKGNGKESYSYPYDFKFEIIFREPVKREDFLQRYVPLNIESGELDLNEELAKKIKTAFETLIILYGGRPVREIF